MNSAVELQQVTKNFQRLTAVNDLSLTVPEGSIYGFIGPNGSGKTTTLRMIMNIFYPDTGRIYLFGQENDGPCLEQVGYLPEERGLYKKMKVGEVLDFYARLKNGREVRSEIRKWLQRFDLLDRIDKKVETLSKGMSQKVQFIAAVIFKPRLLILDEPFSGLDPVNAETIKSAILDLRSQGVTVILSTHDMSVAETLCDYIFMIFKGKKVLDGTLNAIQDQYGEDTIRMQVEGGRTQLPDMEEIQSINDLGQIQEIRLKRGGDPQKVLRTALEANRVRRYELAKPSLHDIFLRIAGPQAGEN